LFIEIFSLITSVSNAVSSILISKGMEKSNPLSASLISTLMQVAILTVFLLADIPEIDWFAITLFAISGAFALGLGRLLNFMSIENIGVAITSSVVGINPLITSFLAILFLGEQALFSTFLGAILVAAGIFLLNGLEGKSFKKRFLIVPFLSALFYAFANVIRKIGLNVQSEPLLGAQVGAAAGTISFLLYLIASGKIGMLRVTAKSFGYYFMAGVSSSLGWIAMMYALQTGNVSIVTTIVFSYPLFSLILSWLFLRGREILSWRTILGCIIIVMGVIVVTLFK